MSKFTFLAICLPDVQVALLQGCFHLNQPRWETAQLVLRSVSDGTDCLQVVREVQDQLRRNFKDRFDVKIFKDISAP